MSPRAPGVPAGTADILPLLLQVAASQLELEPERIVKKQKTKHNQANSLLTLQTLKTWHLVLEVKLISDIAGVFPMHTCKYIYGDTTLQLNKYINDQSSSKWSTQTYRAIQSVTQYYTACCSNHY